MTPSEENEVRRFWEQTNLSTRLIGVRLDVSKNAVIGVAHRRGWLQRPPPPQEPLIPYANRRNAPVPTIYDRLDALHAMMDWVLSDTMSAIAAPCAPVPKVDVRVPF